MVERSHDEPVQIPRSSVSADAQNKPYASASGSRTSGFSTSTLSGVTRAMRCSQPVAVSS